MNILIVDDHALFREGLSLLLSKLFPDMVVGDAKDVDGAREALHQSAAWELVLLDLNMPGMDDFKGLRGLKAAFPEIPMAILSMSDSLEDIHAAIHNGAAGYILKSSDHTILEAAITLLIAGHIYVPPHALSILGGGTSRSEQNTVHPTFDCLTSRERQVLAQIMEGHSNKAIARTLGILEGTVKKHAHAVFRKLGVANRIQAANLARKQGFPTA